MGGSQLWRTLLSQGILELSLFFFLFFFILLLLIKTKVASFLRFLGSLYSPFGALVTGIYSLPLLSFFLPSLPPPFSSLQFTRLLFFPFFFPFFFFPFLLILFTCSILLPPPQAVFVFELALSKVYSSYRNLPLLPNCSPKKSEKKT